jgi:hypothetical protein
VKTRRLLPLLALCCASLAAQTPPSPPTVNALGFSYSLPAGWSVVNAGSLLPRAKQDSEQSAKRQTEKQGIACTQVVLTARHGAPSSIVVVAALPFGCYGQALEEKDLSGFAAGVSDGLKQNLKISGTVTGSYTLAGHSFWIQRAIGAPKDHPTSSQTVEVACSVLKEAAVCWMTVAASPGGLRDFENGPVTLDGRPAGALVPLNAFTKKPL